MSLPQALTVMFIRQSQYAYDSVGAPDYPDLAVSLLYYPVIGWILSRAIDRGALRQAGVKVMILHILAIGIAIAAGEFRNRIWRMGE